MKTLPASGSLVSVSQATALLAVGVVSLVYAVRGGGWLSRPAEHSYAALTKYDPPLGTPVEIPDRDVFGRAIPHGGSTLLVLFGECTECSMNAFDMSKLKAPGFRKVVIVSESEADELKPRFTELGSRSFLVSDPLGHRAVKLNLIFRPRVYVLDERDHLAWCSSKPGEYPSGASYARE